MRDILFILGGYISGSILYAKLFGYLFKHRDITEGTSDGNPGTSNAFKEGGFWCGTLTLICDLLKGFLPVFLYIRGGTTFALAFVVAAPVIGHIFPPLGGFRGGKGIATTFGSLLGFAPYMAPALVLALTFIFFSVILRISPHYYRTLLTYLFAAIAQPIVCKSVSISIGFTIIFVAVTARLLLSKEKKENFEVALLWMH